MPQTTALPDTSALAPPGGRSPFVRLTDLIAGIEPGKPVINLSVGEPQHPIPGFVGPVIAAHLADFGRYPANKGSEPFREAAAQWLGRRFALARPVDPEREVQVLAGTREGLFLAALAAKRSVPARINPVMLIPNPFYAVYAAAAASAGCEPFYLPATRDTGFLPDLDMVPDHVWPRTVAMYLASPSNPQGSVADLAYLKRLVALARRHGFLIFSDECYSEIYNTVTPPNGILEAAGPDFANAVAFHSLSKRSSLPGLRVGFAAGDARFIAAFLELRNVAAAQVPVALQHVGVAAYNDETHVEENRRLYNAKFDLADQIIGDRYGYRRPAGGFFLWLDMGAYGTSETVTKRLWREAGVRVVPGRYLARDQADGSNPGEGYIRVAMVQPKDATAEALHRLVGLFG